MILTAGKMKNNFYLNKDILIRKCQKDDYVFIHDLSKKNMEKYVIKYWGSWNSKKFKEKFNINNISLVQFEGKSVGFFDLEFKENYLYLHNIQLDKSIQGKGVGSYLMKVIEENLKKNKLDKIRLEVFKDSPAKNFYLNLHYKITEDNGTSVTMEKQPILKIKSAPF
jgi:ribosomal protein S18 acetylase RimI-like enzyme